MKNKKKLLIVLLLIAAVLLLSGCTAPKDPATDKIKLITDLTTFSEAMEDSWFQAILVFPIAKTINYLSPMITIAGGIAVVTVLINAIIFGLTIKSTVASQKMQELQPEMQRIQKKYEGKKDERSRMALSNEINQLYKKNNVNPFSMIIVTFIQFPIIIAIFQAVQRSEYVTQGTFLGLSMEQTPWDGIMNGQYLYLVLFILMFACQFLAMSLPKMIAEKKAKAKAEKEHRRYVKEKNKQSMMMYGMMFPIMIFSVVWPAAMTIYWIISSLVMVTKTLIIQKFFIKG